MRGIEASDARSPRISDSQMNRAILCTPTVLGAILLGGLLVLGGALAMTSNAPADDATFAPAPLVPLASEPPARLVVDSPLPEQLALGRVVVRYRAENLRILPVFGPGALDVSPRIGHLHITVDGGPWRWVDSSGEPLIINKLPPGPHKILIELADPTHKVLDGKTVHFDVPQPRTATP